MDFLFLLVKFAPILYLHPIEKYFPCSIEYILDNSLVQPLNQKFAPDTLPLDSYNSSYSTYIDIPDTIWEGQSDWQNVPFYASYYIIDDDLFLQYSFLYCYNGPYYVVLANAGAHQGDLEHITVHITRPFDEIYEIFFGSHQYSDGYWVHRDECQFEKGHPVVFPSYYEHGNYHLQGTWWRYGGVINDHTQLGYKWFPAKLSFIGEETHWIKYQGTIGTSDTPLHHEWWENENKNSNNFWCRFIRINC